MTQSAFGTIPKPYRNDAVTDRAMATLFKVNLSLTVTDFDD